MTKPKRINLVLGGVLAAIWGSIGYQLIGALVEPQTEDVTTIVVETPVAQRESLFVYQTSQRDPFTLVRKARRVVAPKPKVEEPPWTPPPFRLVGIVGHGENNIVMIESPAGDIQFLRVNDTLSGVRILKIERPRVAYSYKKKTVEWVLNE